MGPVEVPKGQLMLSSFCSYPSEFAQPLPVAPVYMTTNNVTVEMRQYRGSRGALLQGSQTFFQNPQGRARGCHGSSKLAGDHRCCILPPTDRGFVVKHWDICQ